MSANFLNVDLEIESSSKPINIEKEFSMECVSNLFSGTIETHHLSTFELHTSEEKENPNGLISEFCSLIFELNDEAKKEWRGASRRVFDIGFEVTDSKQMISTEIKSETLKAVADLGASINITIYPDHFE